MRFKIHSMTARSLITAMNRIRPPQPVHASAGLAHNSVTARPPPTRRGVREFRERQVT